MLEPGASFEGIELAVPASCGDLKRLLAPLHGLIVRGAEARGY